MNQKLNLEWLINPFPFTTFKEEYLEERPLFVNRSNPHYFQTFLDREAINIILNKGRMLGCFDIQVEHPEKSISSNDYANLARFENMEIKVGIKGNTLSPLIQNGARLVVNSIHKISSQAEQLSAKLTEELAGQCQCNLIVMGPAQEIFKPTLCTHDSYVLQVHGSVYLKTYQHPIKLPLSNQNHQPKPDNLSCIGEANLMAGDTAYIPRGYPYHSIGNGGTSAQVIVQSYNITWVRVIHELISEITEIEAVMRSGFVVPKLKSVSNEQEIIATILQRLNEHLTVEHLTAVKAQLTKRFNVGEPRLSQLLSSEHVHTA